MIEVGGTCRESNYRQGAGVGNMRINQVIPIAFILWNKLFARFADLMRIHHRDDISVNSNGYPIF